MKSLCKLNRKAFMGHRWFVGCTLGTSDAELNPAWPYFISSL